MTELAKLNTGNNESSIYKLKLIYNSAIYIKKSVDYLLGLYYLVFEKSYLEKKNT